MRVLGSFYFLNEKTPHAQKAQNVNKRLSLRCFLYAQKAQKAQNVKTTFAQTFYKRIKSIISIKCIKSIKSIKRQSVFYANKNTQKAHKKHKA